MNIVIHVVGSRGDVQPFVSLGKVLHEKYGHRVRLATHPTFKTFVEENGLEFFSIGGDPAELMAFMVKNPGLMPGLDSLKSGDVGQRRKGMYQIVKGCWRSCIEAGNGLDDVDYTKIHDKDAPIRPFIADAIIANPPSFAHIHCAERLGIPLHLMFTMPWSPTQSFPHPLTTIHSSNAEPNITNLVSYALVEMMTWQGLGDVMNRFRTKTLGLEPVSLMWAPGMASRLRIPFTYCWYAMFKLWNVISADVFIKTGHLLSFQNLRTGVDISSFLAFISFPWLHHMSQTQNWWPSWKMEIRPSILGSAQ
jgi:hypothetical protein